VLKTVFNDPHPTIQASCLQVGVGGWVVWVGVGRGGPTQSVEKSFHKNCTTTAQ
jgi:hypothetical protein